MMERLSLREPPLSIILFSGGGLRAASFELVYDPERLPSAIDTCRVRGKFAATCRDCAAVKGDGPDFSVSQAGLPSTHSLLRSLSVVRTLRHFQTVGLSRQDRLDDIE
jgi:hypothetical protein